MAAQGSDAVDITGGDIDGTPIGATTPSTVAGTTLDITGAFAAGTAAWAIGTTQLIKNVAGVFGFGLAPEAWAVVKAIQVGQYAGVSSNEATGNANWSNNAYQVTSNESTGWRRSTANPAVKYSQGISTHVWSGTGGAAADSAITWVDHMTLDASGNLLAGVDNTQTLGGASNRWSTVYAGTGTINTSDAREKTSVRRLTPAEIRASILISKEIGVYQWLASVEEKGDSARQHVGLTVQSVIAIMEAEGLNPMSYGFICYDEWGDEFVEHAEVEYAAAVYDGEDLITAEVQAVDAWTEQTKVAGNRYGFRTDQLNTFLAAGFNARLDAAGI